MKKNEMSYLISRIVLITFFLGFNVLLLIYNIGSTADDLTYNNEEYTLRYIERAASNDQFREVYDELCLYRVPRTEAPDAWEVADAYRNYMLYSSSLKAAHNSPEKAEDHLARAGMEYAELMARETKEKGGTYDAALQRIKDMADNLDNTH